MLIHTFLCIILFCILAHVCTCDVVTQEQYEQFQNDVEHSRLSLYAYKPVFHFVCAHVFCPFFSLSFCDLSFALSILLFDWVKIISLYDYSQKLRCQYISCYNCEHNSIWSIHFKGLY